MLSSFFIEKLTANRFKWAHNQISFKTKLNLPSGFGINIWESNLNVFLLRENMTFEVSLVVWQVE